MKYSQKMGGIAALIMAATFVVGMVFFILVVDYSGVVDPVQKVALLVDNQASLYIMNLIIYVVFGVFLVVLALALYERLKAGSPAMVQTATAFGLIWAGLMFASGMVANIGAGVVIDLYGKDPAQAATVWKLGSLAGRRASQGTELPWRGDRRGRHPHACPGSRRARRDDFWAGSDRVVHMAGDRHVAR
jgi:hypothetical protein